MTYKAQYGQSEIIYTVKRSDRRTLAIEVHPDLSVVVVAPKKAGAKEINEKVVKRANWIRRQLQFFDQFLPKTPPREYVSGETHHYLGRRYVLKVRKSGKESVKLKGGELWIHTRTKTTKRTRQLLSGWYFHLALRRFNESIDTQLEYFKGYHIERPQLMIKRMSRRWGSCTAKGKVIINPEIIKAPSKCIDYVILHELCHLVYPYHDRKFYSLQYRLMPDWERWKGRLERIGV